MLSLLWCLPGAVAAQGADTAALESARQHMEQGQAYYATGDFPAAAAAFLEAYAARDFSAFLFNAAISFERAGAAAEAVTHYERYLERDPGAVDAAEVTVKITNLRAAIAAAAPPAIPEGEAVTGETPTGETPEGEAPVEGGAAEAGTQPTVGPIHVEGPVEDMKSLLSIQTVPSGARISIRQGGRLIIAGPAPFAETLEHGDYQVEVEHPDYRAVQQTLRVRPGKVYVLIVEMSQGEFLGYLNVRTTPPGAAVYIDDRSAGAIGTTPFQNPLPVGTHTVWVERPGFEPAERTVEVILGEQTQLEVPLARVSYGRLRVIGNIAGATVYIDGERAGTVPYEGEIPAGEHEVRVTASGMKRWAEDVVIERGQLTPVRVRLRPSVSRAGAYTTLVLGAAFAGGGLALGLMASDLEDELNRDAAAGTLASDDVRIRRGRFMSYGADAGFGIGAALGLLSIYYFIRDPLPDSEGRVLEPREWSVLPMLDPMRGVAELELRRAF